MVRFVSVLVTNTLDWRNQNTEIPVSMYPPKRYEVLTPGTYEGDPIWKESLQMLSR